MRDRVRAEWCCRYTGRRRSLICLADAANHLILSHKLGFRRLCDAHERAIWGLWGDESLTLAQEQFEASAETWPDA